MPRNKEGQGAMFRNDKGDNPKRPDYRGRCTLGGKEHRISAWIKEAQNGDRYMSLAFQENTDADTSQDDMLQNGDTPAPEATTEAVAEAVADAA